MQFSNSIYKIPIINKLIIYDKTDSTNNQAKLLISKAASESVSNTLIVADCQTGGRGRAGRSFSSPSGEGIYMSLILKPDLDVSDVSGITLLSAVAIYRSLNKYHNITTNIKWPNDILIGRKKATGILTEFLDGYVILGIGINVNNKEFEKSISEVATSLFLETGEKLNREKLIEEIFTEFNELYEKFIETKNLKFITEEYNSALASYNKDIYIIPQELTNALTNTYNIKNDNLETCLCMGISPKGELICRHEDGRLELVSSGEVSIRHNF
ncbi:MAG: biotin--[Lachnospiraceae bacterium]|nr:biotin--[acetyl-CoA-carboxylase] ligase [Lachnospiraceae bacterium]